MNFKTTIISCPFILTEGSIVERLRRDPVVHLDPYIVHAVLIYDLKGKQSLYALYKQYLDIGKAFNLPMITFTPTWRANPARLQQAGFDDRDDVNGDCFHFVSSIREEYETYTRKIFIGGFIGCMGDAYKPSEALTTKEAVSFHRFQVKALSNAGVDFLFAATLPAATEALGIAIAMAECQIPYALSFVIRQDGALLDGTPLHEIISLIDSTVSPKPFFFLINCVHPNVFEKALACENNRSRIVRDRVIGLQANTSLRSPEELDNLTFLDAEEPEELADAMLRLHEQFGIKILGGCCGTDNRHIENLAKRIKKIS
jgi:homocysteine S-methyltransferase